MHVTCGKCDKQMTPKNSKIAPEMFLCDDCVKVHVPELLPPTPQSDAPPSAKEYRLAWQHDFQDERGIDQMIEDYAALRTATLREETCPKYEPPIEGHGRWGCLKCGYSKDSHPVTAQPQKVTPKETK